MISSELILALDIGTSSTRTALFDQEGRCLRETRAQQTYLLRVDRSGMAELPVADLERAVLKTLRITLRARKKDPSLNPRPILAVGASCFWHSLLGYNARTHQTTPIYTWADARCRDDASRLRSRHDEKKYHALTGCMLRTPYWPSKLRWLHRIGAARDVTAWMSPAEWLYARLCGASSISISMASGTGLMNVRTCQWDSSLLRLARVKENHLGTISNEPLQPVREHPAIPSLHRFPELSHARWFPALGDGAASNLGSDATTGSTVAMNVGTSAALRWACRKPPRHVSTGLFCYRIDEQRYLLGGATSNAGNLRAWALAQLRLPDDPAILEKAMAKRVQPDHGLTVLPFWTPERFPSWPVAEGGSITGLGYSTTTLDLLQALIESTYHRLAQLADLLEKQIGRRLDIVVSGGIRKSPQALQMMANVLGRPIRASTETEASLRGAALYVLERLRKKAQPLASGSIIRPRPASARLYAQARSMQIALEENRKRDLS